MRTALVLVALTGVGAFAQSPERAPALEVASVKPATSDPLNYSFAWSLQGGGFRAHLPLVWMIGIAYEIRPLQRITGGPEWVRTLKFDVEARAGREIKAPDRFAMLRALLEDRFRLVLRREPGEMAGHALSVARADGRLGPGLRRSNGECVKTQGGHPPISERQLLPGRPVPCGLAGAGRAHGGGAQPIRILISTLRRLVGTEIADHTGLTGLFDYYFTANDAGLTAAPGAPDEMSVFTAVQEQLGLRLQRTQIASEFFAIERAEHPEPN